MLLTCHFNTHTHTQSYHRSYLISPPADSGALAAQRCGWRHWVARFRAVTLPVCLSTLRRVCVRVCGVLQCVLGVSLNKQVLKARRLPQLNSVPITISGTWGPKSLLGCLTESTIGQDDTSSQQHHIYACTFTPFKLHTTSKPSDKHFAYSSLLVHFHFSYTVYFNLWF